MSQKNRFDGIAIVTASSRGIGRAVAETLGRRGAQVVVNYRSSKDEADAVVDVITTAGGKAITVQGDVSNPDDVSTLFDRAEQEGPISTVVHVAGIGLFKPLAECELKDFEAQTAVNSRGAFLVLREAARRVKEGGRIVHVATGGTQQPIPNGGLYSGSKAYGEMLALCLAKELGPRGINVNVVAPGVTDTDGLVMEKAQVDQMVSQTPLGRLGKPQDIANAIALLCDQDAGWITAQTINVNGGLL